MGDVDHMIGVDGPEGSKPIADDGEEGDQDIINDVDHVVLLCTNRNPTNEEKDPGKTKQRNQSSVEGDEEAEWSTNITTKSLETSFELGPTRVQHVADVIIQPIDIFLTPALEGGAVWQDGIVGVLQIGSDTECTSRPGSFTLLLCQIFLADVLERIRVAAGCGTRSKRQVIGWSTINKAT